MNNMNIKSLRQEIIDKGLKPEGFWKMNKDQLMSILLEEQKYFGLIAHTTQKDMLSIIFQDSSGKTMTWREVMNAIIHSNQAFLKCWINTLKSITFPGYFFECNAVSVSTLDNPFQCAIINNDGLATIKPNPKPFMEHIKNTSEDIIVFLNTSGETILIVPTDHRKQYGHLAQFVHNAPDDISQNLWITVMKELKSHLSTKSLWLSTHGLGVSWLHIRIDPIPKYYHSI